MWQLALTVLVVPKLLLCNAGRSSQERSVLDLLDAVRSSTNVSASCRNGIVKMESIMWSDDSIPEQREFFTSAYATGTSSQFSTTDLDRWIYRAYECLQSARETSFSSSMHPTSYCIGYNQARQGASDEVYGVCMPTDCYNDKEQYLDLWRSVDSSKRGPLEDVWCIRSRHEYRWFERPWPMLEFIVHFAFMVIVVVATVYHIRSDPVNMRRGSKMLIAFSAKKNIERLVQMPKDARSTITCMFGMRFLSMAWTLIGHSFAVAQVFIKNVNEYKDDLVNGFLNQWITNFTLSVDTFFVLSGTLTAYAWFKKALISTSVSRPSWTSAAYWLRFYRHRLIRIWPAYIYTILDGGMRASLQHYHATWPSADPAVQCPKYWWQNVLFINTIYANRCMPWTWYIGTEFIFYILSPVFLLTLRDMPRCGFAFALVTIFASALLNAVGLITWNFPPTQLFWRQPRIFSTDFVQHHIVMYIKPWYRIGPYIVGILLGYHLASLQNSKPGASMSARWQLIGWLFTSVAGFCCIFGLYPALQGWNCPVYHIAYGATHRTVFALAIAWIIYACHAGYGGMVNWLLSMKFLIPLSTLSYSAYLVHVIFVVFTYLLTPFPMTYVSKWPIFAHCIAQLLLSYFFGILCALIAELPAVNLERIIFSDDDEQTIVRHT